MKLRTEYKACFLRDAALDPERPIVLLGSCFSDNIGRLMRKTLWNAAVNPCGVLFNPLSVASTIRNAVEGAVPRFAQRGGVTVSWDFDSSFSSVDPQICLDRCADGWRRLRESLRLSQALIVTFGTAWVYALGSDRDDIVCNCHKFPASDFTRYRVTVEEIADIWSDTLNRVREINSGIKFIFTVSPVRHLRDGFAENSLSKATLRLACDRIVDEARRVGIVAEYFPAFEIITDDLRDYRFYADDLAHPAAMASEYVWEKFQQVYLDDESRRILGEGAALVRRFAHRSIMSGSAEEISFRQTSLCLAEEFGRRHPGMLRPDMVVSE